MNCNSVSNDTNRVSAVSVLIRSSFTNGVRSIGFPAIWSFMAMFRELPMKCGVMRPLTISILITISFLRSFVSLILRCLRLSSNTSVLTMMNISRKTTDIAVIMKFCL